MAWHMYAAGHSANLAPLLALTRRPPPGRLPASRTPARVPLPPDRCAAPRWHLDYLRQRDGSSLVVVVRRCSACELPITVRPSRPSLADAAMLADALNRAYAIEPVSGFDVSGLTGLDIRPHPPAARAHPH